MEKYVYPEIEVIVIENADVITTSDDNPIEGPEIEGLH